jgi:hypothetical protein
MAWIKEKLQSPLLLFSLASFYFFLLGLQGIAKNAAFTVSLSVAAFFIIVLLVQLLCLKVVFLYVRMALPRSAVLALFLAANLIGFYLSFSGRFMSMANWQIALAILLVAFLFTLLLRISGLGRILSLFLCLFIVSNLMIMSVSIIFSDNSDHQIGSLEAYRNINFDQKPNVHLVSFDSMLPEVLARKHMGLEQLSYSDYLENEGAIIFKNMFSSRGATSPSLNSVMRFANPGFKSTGYFAGRSESPVSYVFRNNGYKVATGFDTIRTFGTPGSYVDEYRTQNPKSIKQSAICRFNGPKSDIMRLFGFCYYIASILFEPKLDEARWPQIVFGIIGEKGKSPDPWLTFHYIYNPIGHTSETYGSRSPAELDEYTRYFLERSNLAGNTILPELVKTIKANDPTAIVFVFGDHGPGLSRSLKLEESPEFYVQDRNGVFGALLATDQPCSMKDIEYYNKEFSTPERVLSGVVRCLATDPDSVDQLANFNEEFEFRKYLYE